MTIHHRPIEIDSLADPRLAPYRHLKDRDLAREGNRFIAEGETVVKRLLASPVPAESILLARHRAGRVLHLVPPGLTTYIADASLVNQLIGFRFHSGIMAVGIRPPSPDLHALLDAHQRRRCTLLVCPEIANTDNLGALIRIAAGLGASAMVLGQRSCDPFYRQSVRVSMGAVFHLPIVRCADLDHDLQRLGQRQVQLIATTLDPHATPLHHVATRPPHIAILLGNEAHGLSPSHLAQCTHHVTIPMANHTDSLNVTTAAAIILHWFQALRPL